VAVFVNLFNFPSCVRNAISYVNNAFQSLRLDVTYVCLGGLSPSCGILQINFKADKILLEGRLRQVKFLQIICFYSVLLCTGSSWSMAQSPKYMSANVSVNANTRCKVTKSYIFIGLTSRKTIFLFLCGSCEAPSPLVTPGAPYNINSVLSQCLLKDGNPE